MAGFDDLLSEGTMPEADVPLEGEVVSGGTPNRELVNSARDAMAGNWTVAVIGTFLYSLLFTCIILFSASYAYYLGMIGATGEASDLTTVSLMVYVAVQIISLLLQGPVMVGYNSFCLGIVQDHDTDLNRLFSGFKRFGASFGTMLLSWIVISLWTLLLVIPGIIAAFRYSMVFYVIADEPEAGPMEAMRRSRAMMKGNKWKLFCLYCRFIGWAILSSLTGGLGHLWLVPYMQTAKAQFYEDVKWNQFG